MEVNNKRTNVKMFHIFDWPEDGHANPGAVIKKDCYTGFLVFACIGCGALGSIRIDKDKSPDSPFWKIESGSIEECNLTLSPSINCVGCCGWHGFLKNGIFECC